MIPRPIIALFCLALLASACAPAAPAATPSPAVPPASPTLAPSHTPAPTRTPSPVPSPTSLAYLPVNFDLSPQNYTLSLEAKPLPADVLREVARSGDFGGGGNPCDNSGKTFSEPTFLYGEGIQYEWYEYASFYSCGWPKDENILVELIAPGGDVIHAETRSVWLDSGAFGFGYQIPLSTPPGQYQVRFTGDSHQLIFPSFDILVPTAPRLYYDTEANLLVLYNFQPNENVTLLAYAEGRLEYISHDLIKTLIDWRAYQVDPSGQLIISIDWQSLEDHSLIDISYVIIGDQSGEVQVFTTSWSKLRSSALSTTDVVAYFPTQEEERNSRSIWDFIEYRDLARPGTETYAVTIAPAEPLHWRFSWCATDQKKLAAITAPLEIEFLINGQPLQTSQLARYTEVTARGSHCHRWVTYIPQWPPNTLVDLDIHYTLSQQIFDGAATYPPGDYHQLIRLTITQ